MNVMTLASSWTQVEAAAREFAAADLFAPIQSEEQYSAVLNTVERLMLEVSEASGGEPHVLDSLIDILADRLERYETSLLGPPAGAPREVLAYLLHAHKLTQNGLARATGLDQGTLSKVLKGNRTPSKAQAAKLAAYFRISPALLLV
jgi:HTH-type transcriptional regulator/antitoxin HigA